MKLYRKDIKCKNKTLTRRTRKSLLLLAVISFLFLPTANAEMIVENNEIEIWQIEGKDDIVVIIENITVNNSENFSRVYFHIDNYIGNTGRVYATVGNMTKGYNITKYSANLYYFELNNTTIEANTSFKFYLYYHGILKDGKFTKKFYYNTNFMKIIVYPLNFYEVKGNNVQIVKATSESFEGANITLQGTAISINANETITLEFVKIQEQQTSEEDFTIYIIALFFIFAIALIGVLISKYKKGEKLKEDRKDRKSKRDRRKTREEDEEISKREKEEIEDRGKLSEKKKKLLLAIKKLDKLFENGELDKEIYEEMRNEYKKKVIEIMKKLE